MLEWLTEVHELHSSDSEDRKDIQLSDDHKRYPFSSILPLAEPKLNRRLSKEINF